MRISDWSSDVCSSDLYTVEDLKGHILASDQPEGEHVRSFQLMAKRIRAKPDLAKILVHKPGPLHDKPDEIPDYADVFRRGVLEVAELLKGVRARTGDRKSIRLNSRH